MRTPSGDFILFTNTEAPGALRNKTRVVKVMSEPNDAHSIGAKGRVVGSVYSDELGFGYFIEWDDMPGLPVMTAGKKVLRCDD